MEQYGYQPPAPKEKPAFPTGKREFGFAAVILIIGWLLCNSVFYGGFNLGYAIFAAVGILASAGYLLLSGCKPTGYSISLLALSLVIVASFARSDDGFVKFVMLCFLTVSINLGLCLLAGKNRRNPKGFLSLFDVPRTMFVLGMGRIGEAFLGMGNAFRKGGNAAKRSGAVVLGLVIAVPILAILIPLLMNADAAFEALLDLLPQWNMEELFTTAVFGTGLGIWFYIRGAALRHDTQTAPVKEKGKKGLHPVTVNTVLAAVGVVYLVYLFSQLAYFSGGLSGILPEGFTVSEYARRGFFETAWLCAVNLTVMALSAGLVRREEKAPLVTRLLCLFIGIVTLFLVVTASAKMFLYIGSYGLTRLRVLTEVITVFLGITTVLLTVWLFVPKLPYMKAILLIGLLIGAVVSWVDVDTVVADYNVRAYQSGKLETVDVWYLAQLGDGAVPYLYRLTQDADPEVATQAKRMLQLEDADVGEDFRGWNYVSNTAAQYLQEEDSAVFVS